jgi:hypothetical protein
MAFSDWGPFEKLVDELAPLCSGATSFESFDDAVRGGRADLVDGEYGYDALMSRLMNSGDYTGVDILFEHLRLVALAGPAEHFDMGPAWAGLWISADHHGAQVCAGLRFAALADWAPLPFDSGEQTTGADPAAQQLDEATGRWRRYVEQDDEYEYHHTADDVWERSRDSLWHRFHDRAGRWLAYDEPSGTWLDGDRWRPFEEVGAPVTVADDEADDEASAGEVVAAALAAEFRTVVAGVRALGVTAEEMSDDEIYELFGQRAQQLLAEQVPDIGKQG